MSPYARIHEPHLHVETLTLSVLCGRSIQDVHLQRTTKSMYYGVCISVTSCFFCVPAFGPASKRWKVFARSSVRVRKIFGVLNCYICAINPHVFKIAAGLRGNGAPQTTGGCRCPNVLCTVLLPDKLKNTGEFFVLHTSIAGGVVHFKI